MSRLGAAGLLLITAFLWGVTFVAQIRHSDHAGARLRRRALCRAGGSSCAVGALKFCRKPHAPSPRRTAPCARDRPHAVPRRQLAAGGDRATSVTNAGFLTACYVVLTPFVVWALTRARSSSARAQYRPSAPGCSPRAGRSVPEPRRRARAPRRFRLGDGDRADADLPRPLSPAAAARLCPISGLRPPHSAVLGPVRVDSPGRTRSPPRRRSFSPSRACSPRSQAGSCSMSV